MVQDHNEGQGSYWHSGLIAKSQNLNSEKVTNSMKLTFALFFS